MTEVTLSDAGIMLILLENELANNTQAMRRWARRENDAHIEMQELRKQREQLVNTLELLKKSI